ncbi:MAG: hypothetical protein GX174_12350 [Lentisphaerae bacterium]|nr:hypothetical protein [Lentisphaerota bacterium]
MAVGKGRQPPAVPAVPAGSAVPGLEDEEAPRSPPGSAGRILVAPDLRVR